MLHHVSDSCFPSLFDCHFLSCRGPSSRRRAIIDIHIICARPFAIADYLRAAICRCQLFVRGHLPPGHANYLRAVIHRPAIANYLRAANCRPAIANYLRAAIRCPTMPIICARPFAARPCQLFACGHSPPGHANYLCLAIRRPAMPIICARPFAAWPCQLFARGHLPPGHFRIFARSQLLPGHR